jgi:hypothetical protein
MMVSVPEYETACVGVNWTPTLHVVSLLGTPFPFGLKSSSLHCIVTENGDGVGEPLVVSISIRIGSGWFFLVILPMLVTVTVFVLD